MNADQHTVIHPAKGVLHRLKTRRPARDKLMGDMTAVSPAQLFPGGEHIWRQNQKNADVAEGCTEDIKGMHKQGLARKENELLGYPGVHPFPSTTGSDDDAFIQSRRI